VKVDGSCQPDLVSGAEPLLLALSSDPLWQSGICWATTAGDESAVEGSRLAAKVEAAPTVKDACPEISGWGSELEGLETSKKTQGKIPNKKREVLSRNHPSIT